MNFIRIGFFLVISLMILSCQTNQNIGQPINISGVYPSLAYYNDEGECGTGAVVPWADRLWVITYGPHLPNGSSDKLYEITPDLEQIVRKESIGGTPANRMIHKESNQLFIGPYAIDHSANVRVIPYNKMPGRHTGNARHLRSPTDKIYYGTMEEGFYEVDVKSLEVTTLYPDANKDRKEGEMAQYGALLPGAHGKGLYSGQGVLVFSNNGEASREALTKFDAESGALLEWDGSDWKLIRRNQFVEVTGPGGIYGNENPETDPIWATGWDHKSVILGCRDHGEWKFFRLPKASHSYDGAHGWNTEWPRIRNIGTSSEKKYLMTMHGMFWDFPGTFSHQNASGIRPRSAYLKVIGDFARWKGQLVFGCDDSAQREFLNKRKAKGNIEGPGQSNSNLWFTSTGLPDSLGPTTAEGAVWLNENVKPGAASEPFLFAGWKKRCAWIKNEGKVETTFTFQSDDFEIKKILGPNEAQLINFPEEVGGEWIQVLVDKETMATVHYSYTGTDTRSEEQDQIFDGLALTGSEKVHGGLLYGLGEDRRSLGIAAVKFDGMQISQSGYYELDERLNLLKKGDPATEQFIREKFAIPENVITIDSASVLIVDDKKRRWRIPFGANDFKDFTEAGQLRIAREVATERDLFSCFGTFFELPAENADGFAKMRPVSTHGYRIHDYASYRGLLVMTGIDPILSGEGNDHIIVSNDRNASVWVGVVDDLWKLGKPTGEGGPWKNTLVKRGESSDPYLIGFYDKKTLDLSHQMNKPVSFKVEVDPMGNGTWFKYLEVEVEADKVFTHKFPPSFQARWIRFTTDSDTEATAWLTYE